MNRADEVFRVSEMISRCILGELTDAEKLWLEKWVEVSPENKELFDRLVGEKMLSEKVRAYGRINRKEPLEELLNRKKQLERSVRRRRVTRVVGYAAAILLPLAVVFYFYIRPGRGVLPAEPRLEARVELPAGESKAILQLADGKVVELTPESSRHIARGDRVTIKQDSGIIKYKVDGSTMRQKERFNTITVPRGAEFSLELSDGTRVWLNAESRLRFPEEFVGRHRKVYLEGEAYFDVSCDPEKRFEVQTESAEIRVYGTEFNILAYKDEREITTTLVKGSVGIKVKGTKERVRLEPGEQACLVGNKITKREVDTEIYTAWAEGKWIIEGERLENIMKQLARWYDVKVFYQNPRVKDLVFTGDLEKYNNCEVILNIISMTTNVVFEVKDNTITVKM